MWDGSRGVLTIRSLWANSNRVLFVPQELYRHAPFCAPAFVNWGASVYAELAVSRARKPSLEVCYVSRCRPQFYCSFSCGL